MFVCIYCKNYEMHKLLFTLTADYFNAIFSCSYYIVASGNLHTVYIVIPYIYYYIFLLPTYYLIKDK